MEKIKVAYLYDFAIGQDYMNDAVYHGLIDSGLFDVYEYRNPSYMLKSYPDISKLYGAGFTMFGKLDHIPQVEPEAEMCKKIENKFYDIVIYGCIYKGANPFKKQVLSVYSKDEIHVIDGNDGTQNYANSHGFNMNNSTIWKTSLTSLSVGNPIQFAIPESQLITYKPVKEKLFSDYDPRKVRTYLYTNEADYYNDYATSYYGYVTKRSAWNTMRILEIMANRCVPYFIGSESLPQTMMLKTPKELIMETNKYAEQNEIHPNYDEICEEIFQFTKNNLTTKELIKIFLK